MKRVLFILCFIIASINTSVLFAQENILADSISPIVFTATRIPPSTQNHHYALTSVATKDSLLAPYPNVSLKEQLDNVPGLVALNALNQVQDLRISIRGFGARSAFGIRGVKILVDGIPETTPDGTGQVDNIDMHTIDRIQVLRGPSSGLFGNASGGVLSLTTLAPNDKNRITIDASIGSFKTRKFFFSSNFDLGKTAVNASIQYLNNEGFREYSDFQNLIVNASAVHTFSENHQLKFLFNNSNSPRANDPGGITFEEAQSLIDRAKANETNKTFGAHEQVEQSKIALQYTYDSKNNLQIHSQVFFIDRHFSALLPFENLGRIVLDRAYYGHTTHMTVRRLFHPSHTLNIGYELLSQNDDRIRGNNNFGFPSTTVLKQKETFHAASFFLSDKLTFYKKLNASVDLRYDHNAIAINRQTGTPYTDDRYYNTVNGGAGLQYNYDTHLNPYLRISTSFETPTLNELFSNPDFNIELEKPLVPQTSINYEIGNEGVINQMLDYEVTGYLINTKDEVVQFSDPDFPEKDFFRNAGKTRRMGIESYLKMKPNQHLHIILSFTQAVNKFTEYNKDGNVLDGNRIPGIPSSFGGLQFAYSYHTLKVTVDNSYIGSMFADDNNEVEIPSYFKTDFRFSKGIQIPQSTLDFYFGLNNLFNAFYNDNIRINAFGGRYYEPAPSRNIYIGFRLMIG